MWSPHRSNHGFTLIELLVVTTVGVLMLSGAVIAYNSFLQRQISFSSGQVIISLLRQAQIQARSGDKPAADCTTLTGYRVSGEAGQQQFFVDVICDGNLIEPVERRVQELTPAEVFVSSFSMLFPSLPGSVAATDQTIGIKQLGNTESTPRFEIPVSGGGVIGEGTYVR